MMCYVYDLPPGALGMLDVMGRDVFMHDMSLETSVFITLQELEETPLTEFLAAAPFMITAGLEHEVGRQLAHLRQPVAWEHFMFFIRQPIIPFFIVHRLNEEEAGLAPGIPAMFDTPQQIGDTGIVRPRVTIAEPPEGTLLTSIGFHASMIVEMAITPMAPIFPDGYTPPGPFPQLPFYTRAFPGIGEDEAQELLRTTEGHRQLTDLLADCFLVGVPPI